MTIIIHELPVGFDVTSQKEIIHKVELTTGHLQEIVEDYFSTKTYNENKKWLDKHFV
jgi:hypothetical protein